MAKIEELNLTTVSHQEIFKAIRIKVSDKLFQAKVNERLSKDCERIRKAALKN